MRIQKPDFIVLFLVILATVACGAAALAQSSATQPSNATVTAPSPNLITTPSATISTATTTAASQQPGITAKDLDGLDVFGSEGQQIGKVTKTEASPDGKVKDVEVQSKGFLGFFKKTYVVPADKLTKKGGRIDVSMTSDQVKLLSR